MTSFITVRPNPDPRPSAGSGHLNTVLWVGCRPSSPRLINVCPQAVGRLPISFTRNAGVATVQHTRRVIKGRLSAQEGRVAIGVSAIPGTAAAGGCGCTRYRHARDHEPRRGKEMAQPHKGHRSQVVLSLSDEILTLVDGDTERQHISSRSQYLADLVCQAYGRPDLARELNQEGSQMELTDQPRRKALRTATKAPSSAVRKVKIRVPDEVVSLIDHDTESKQVSSRNQYVTDLVCKIYNRPDLARELPRQERGDQLKLPVPGRRAPAA